jgi:hypothetical protein
MRLVRLLILAIVLGFTVLSASVTGPAQAAPIAASSLASQVAPPELQQVTPAYYYYRRHYWHRHYWHRHYWHRHYWHRHYWRRHHYRRYYW